MPVLENFDIKKDKVSYAAVISGLCIRETVEGTLITTNGLCPNSVVAQSHLRPPQRMRRHTWSGPPQPTYNNHDGQLVSILPVRKGPSSELWVTNVQAAYDNRRRSLARTLHGRPTITTIIPWVFWGTPTGQPGQSDEDDFGRPFIAFVSSACIHSPVEYWQGRPTWVQTTERHDNEVMYSSPIYTQFEGGM